MENLPKHIRYDLEGYRGFGIVKMPLVLWHYNNGKVSASYSWDAAEYCPYLAFGDTEEEAKRELLKQLKMDKYGKRLD